MLETLKPADRAGLSPDEAQRRTEIYLRDQDGRATGAIRYTF